MTGQPDVRAACAALDQALKAIMLAKSMLLAETSEPTPAHPFTRPGQTGPEWPPPDACIACGLPETAHPEPGPEDGSTPPLCMAAAPGLGFACDRPTGHDGRHMMHTWDSEPLASWAPAPPPGRFCAAHHPDGALCTRPEDHDGDHASRGMHTRWAQGSHLGPGSGHQLRSIAVPSGDAA